MITFKYLMNERWVMFTWLNIKKMLILISFIILFFPFFYFILPNYIGVFRTIFLYFVFLFVVGYLISLWGKKKIKG